MVEKAKIFYFSVFILVVFAFIFHVTAMGHHHWKKAVARNSTFADRYNIDRTNIGIFTRCIVSSNFKEEICFPNLFPNNKNCSIDVTCLARQTNSSCSCDFLPSTKGIAACSIIAAIFLGLAIVILFIHSISTSETRTIGLVLGLFPLILLLLAFIFILITLILVGSYLSRDIMNIIYQSTQNTDSNFNVEALRNTARESYQIRVDWSTGLEIISLFFTFLSLILYMAYVFKFGRS